MDIKSNFKTTCKVTWQSFYQGTVEFESCTSGQVAWWRQAEGQKPKEKGDEYWVVLSSSWYNLQRGSWKWLLKFVFRIFKRQWSGWSPYVSRETVRFLFNTRAKRIVADRLAADGKGEKCMKAIAWQCSLFALWRNWKHCTEIQYNISVFTWWGADL